MFEPASERAAPGFGYVAAAAFPPPSPAAHYELRPLSVGEILDRTFSLYRGRFWLYCGLSALSAAVGTVIGLIQIFIMKVPVPGAHPATPADSIAALTTIGVAGLVGLVAGILHFIAYAVTQAATVSAVSSIYLGHETSMAIALKAARPKWWRYPGIALWQVWSAGWIFMLLFIPAIMLMAMKDEALAIVAGLLMLVAVASLIYGIIAYIRNSLGIAVSVFEGMPVRASMRRSKLLVAGSKGRIFLVLVLLYVLSLVAGVLQMPFVLILMRSHTGAHFVAQGLSVLMAFLSNSLIGPVGAIAFCLFYFDTRVRKEGFDIEALMDPTLGSSLRRPVVATPELLPSGFAPSGFTASPFAPSGFTAAPPPPPPPAAAQSASPFAPSGFTVAPDRPVVPSTPLVAEPERAEPEPE